MANKEASQKSQPLFPIYSVLIFFKIFIGLFFAFSGFVKAVDPLGTSYKFTDYLTAFGIDFLLPMTLFCSVLLSCFEFWLGISLLIGYQPKRTSILLLLFISFMTPLTLYIAINNPVTDCGCFGDAIHLSNWQTFFKNIILLLITVFILYHHKKILPLFSDKTQWLVSLYTIFFSLSISWVSYQYLPILDFRPYKIGNNILKGMEIPEGAPENVYDSKLIYEKDNVQKEFSINALPDSTWKFVRKEIKLIQQGYIPPIHDFNIKLAENGEDITNQILNDTSYTFLLISPRLTNASDENIDRINELYDYSRNNHYAFYCLTASFEEEIEEWKDNTGAEYPFATADEITLKTIIRPNPGLILLRNGTIIHKWPHSLLPSEKELNEPLNDLKLEELVTIKDKSKYLFLTFAFVFPLLALFLLEKSIHKLVSRKRKTKVNVNDSQANKESSESE